MANNSSPDQGQSQGQGPIANSSPSQPLGQAGAVVASSSTQPDVVVYCKLCLSEHPSAATSTLHTCDCVFCTPVGRQHKPAITSLLISDTEQGNACIYYSPSIFIQQDSAFKQQDKSICRIKNIYLINAFLKAFSFSFTFVSGRQYSS